MAQWTKAAIQFLKDKKKNSWTSAEHLQSLYSYSEMGCRDEEISWTFLGLALPLDEEQV